MLQHRMIHCSRSSLNVLVLTPLLLISVMLDPFHLEVPFSYILLSTSNLDPSSSPIQILILTATPSNF